MRHEGRRRRVCHETIYRFVYSPKGQAQKLGRHLPERRRMMQAWADTCDALETGADVVPIHSRQSP